MTLVDMYREARRDEEVARCRRVTALRAMAAEGMPQRRIAEAIGVSQPAVSQQLGAARLDDLHPELLLDAAAPILRTLASDHGFGRLAVFGSVARRTARPDSDIDLIVEAPAGTSMFDLLGFKRLVEQVLGRQVDLVEYGGLDPVVDEDVRREAVLL